jgi:hypothetical protein
MLQINEAGFHRVNRDTAMMSCFKSMEHRRKLKEGQNPNDKDANPLIAFAAPPGSGKSFFADEVAACREEDLNFFCPTAMQSILRRSISVAVTFNGATPVTTGGIDSVLTPDQSLGIRVLYR